MSQNICRVVENCFPLRGKAAPPLIKMLKAVKEKHGFSFLILSHTPKRLGIRPITKNDLSGSKQILNHIGSAFAIGDSRQEATLLYVKQIKKRNSEFQYDKETVLLCRIVKDSNFLHFESYKRNEHFANICYVLHLMEREGSGYDKMYESQLSLGKSVPQVIEGDDYVKAVVERRIRSVDALKLMQDVKERFPLKQKALICLGFIAQYGPVSGSELVKKLDLSGSNALRAWLNPLLENGLVESTDEK